MATGYAADKRKSEDGGTKGLPSALGILEFTAVEMYKYNKSINKKYNK
jgi:hypothetical protein